MKGGWSPLKYEKKDPQNFYLEMENHQLTAKEFFSPTLLEYLNKNFDLDQMVILYFDTEGNFLSWVTPDGLAVDGPNHPYREVNSQDPIRQIAYEDAVRDHLTYFNLIPRLYRSTDVISSRGYRNSAYVKFIRKYFASEYSVTMAFGINAYIQVVFLRSYDGGDYTEDEMANFHNIYQYIASAYKTFKKYEQAKIISSIKNQIIAEGEKAYFITDDFMNVLDCNDEAILCLQDILGPAVKEELKNESPSWWLPFLFSNDQTSHESIKRRVIKKYVFKIHVYDQSYSNLIIDRYYWVTISNVDESTGKHVDFTNELDGLTPAEQRVAELMYQGLTYKAIATRLVLSYHTVKKHVENIYTKLGIQNRYQLIRWIEKQQ